MCGGKTSPCCRPWSRTGGCPACWQCSETLECVTDQTHARGGGQGERSSQANKCEREAARGDSLIPISARERVFLSPVSAEHLLMEIPEKREPPSAGSPGLIKTRCHCQVVFIPK